MHTNAADIEFLNRGQQLKWERVLDPILRDDGLDLGFHERAHLLQDRQLIGGQSLCELVEVRIGLRKCFFNFFCWSRHEVSSWSLCLRVCECTTTKSILSAKNVFGLGR